MIKHMKLNKKHCTFPQSLTLTCPELINCLSILVCSVLCEVIGEATRSDQLQYYIAVGVSYKMTSRLNVTS